MTEYKLLVAVDVFDYLSTLKRVQGSALRRRFDEIRDSPGQHSDCQQSDESGRRLDVKICGGFAIAYWTDHADKHLKILDIYLADQAAS